jgi:hypothetical protein
MNIDFDDIDDFVRRAEEVCDELDVLGMVNRRPSVSERLRVCG